MYHKNKSCQAKPTLVDINSNDFLIHLFVRVNKCGGSCNTISYPYAGVCVPGKAKIWMQKYLI